LICTDEEPPRSINKEALEVALQVAKLLKAEIPDEIHIMRKTVIDGSNTCAFQRTAIIGLNGILETSLGKVEVTNICLEEESAGIVEQKGNEITYRLDRLGIPLIEIGTATDIKNPEHAKDVAEKLGMIIRSTGKSQRGIGVTREDINVSIKGGARVEIKGVQELDLIPEIIESEIKRQQEMITKGQKPKKETRIAKQDGTTIFTRPLPGGERLYPETDTIPITITKKTEQIIKSEYLDMFEKFYKKYDPLLVASTFASTTVSLRRIGIDVNFSEEEFDELFSSVKKKIISKEAIPDILGIVSKDKVSVKKAIEKSGLKALSEDELRKIIRDILKSHPELVKKKHVSALMGEIMAKTRGRIDGETVSKTLNEELNKRIK